MNHSIDDLPTETLLAGERVLLRCAIRALLLSHPAPKRLRTEWNAMVSQMWMDHAANLREYDSSQLEPISRAMKAAQETMESFLPPA